MKALVFCADLYHSAATARAGLAPLAASGAWEFDWIEDAAGWEPQRLGDYRAVVLTKANVCSPTDRTPWLAGATESALSDYVRAGGGLLAVHSGTSSYRDWPATRAVLGGVFAQHPPPGDEMLAPRTGHALTCGVSEAFTVHDEHYEMLMDDAGVDVFLHSHSATGVQPAGWTRHEGAGRVCVLTPGHFVEVWLQPAMQRLLANGLAWVAAR